MKNIKCKVVNCNNESYGLKEYCRKHYLQIQRHGRLTPEKERNTIAKGQICCIANCNKSVYAKNLCENHWRQERKNIIENEINLGIRKVSKCKVEGCEEYSKIKGYCKRHYKQVYKHGKVMSV